MPTADEVKRPEDALAVFDPVLSAAHKQLDIVHTLQIKQLTKQLEQSQQRISELQAVEQERSEHDQLLADEQARREAAREEKYDQQRFSLKQALKDVERSTKERDSAIEEGQSHLATAQAKADSDVTEFESILDSKLQEQAIALASESKMKKQALEAKLMGLVRERDRAVESKESEHKSELERQARLLDHAAETNERLEAKLRNLETQKSNAATDFESLEDSLSGLSMIYDKDKAEFIQLYNKACQESTDRLQEN